MTAPSNRVRDDCPKRAMESLSRREWEAVYRSERDRIVRRLTRLAGSTAAAEDTAQEAILRLLSADPSPATYNASGLLHRTAWHLALNARKSEARQAKREGDYAALREDSVVGPEEIAASQELARACEHALAEVAPRWREAFLLHRLTPMSHATIAGRMGVSASMVEKYIMRARAACVTAVGDSFMEVA